jgi:hypothetical protein
MKNPAVTLAEVSLSYAVPRCLHVIAELGVADALEDQPRTAAELAASTGANAEAIARALRLVSAYGIFEWNGDTYVHTPESRLLRSDHPQSMRSFVRMIGFEFYWRTFEGLAHSIRTGESSFEHQIAPGGAWAYLATNPDLSKIFDEAMTGKAHGQIAGILAGYDFSRFKIIVTRPMFCTSSTASITQGCPSPAWWNRASLRGAESRPSASEFILSLDAARSRPKESKSRRRAHAAIQLTGAGGRYPRALCGRSVL